MTDSIPPSNLWWGNIHRWYKKSKIILMVVYEKPQGPTWCHTCLQHLEASQTCLEGHSLCKPKKIVQRKKVFWEYSPCHCRRTAPCPWQCWSPSPGWWSRCSCSPSYRAGTLHGTPKTWKQHKSLVGRFNQGLTIGHPKSTHLALRMALWHSSIFPSHLIFTSVKVDLGKFDQLPFQSCST